jgi:hypothetical protein
MIDEVKLHQFIGQMLSDLGGASSIAMVRIGDALGALQGPPFQGGNDGGGTRCRSRRKQEIPARVAFTRRPRTTSHTIPSLGDLPLPRSRP